MNVELIDSMGSDLSVVNAARVSFSKESFWVEENGYPWLSLQDEKLIKYLATHDHWTPFGHCFASFRIKAPIFVARQLGKHQVGLVWNEVSRRYVDDEPEFYSPPFWRAKAPNVKQGSAEYPAQLSPYTGILVDDYALEAKRLYERLLAEGVCPEQARMVLPQSMMTEWIWSGSLVAFSRVCWLRLDPHTQYETQLIARQIYAEMERLFPVSWKALQNDYPAS
jgi:thymidylate synthase (FAD)